MINTIKQTNKSQEEITEIKISKLPDFSPPPHHKAKYCVAGDFITMEYTEKKVLTHVRRIDATHYENLRTGEIREYRKHSEEERLAARRSTLKRTFSQLRAIIRANFGADASNQLFITLTYAENMVDPKRLLKNFNYFMERLKYSQKQHDLEYVVVMEPQERGAWHAHLLLKSTNQDYLFIPDAEVRRCWRQGITDTQRLKSDDVGRYYTAYFTGLITGVEYTAEEAEFLGEECTSEEIYQAEKKIIEENKLSKAYVKGARLHYYPKHFKFYRCSRNIIRPQKFEEIIGVMDDCGDVECKQSYLVAKVYLEAIRDKHKGSVEPLNRIHKVTYRKKGRSLETKATNFKENIVVAAKERLYQMQLTM